MRVRTVMSKSGYDRHITVFSPDGKIYQVEYALKAVKSAGVTAIAALAKNGAVVVTQKFMKEKIFDTTDNMFLFDVSKNVFGCVTGRPADCRSLISRARDEALEFAYTNGYEMETDVLARRMADLAQVSTQHARVRPLGAALLLYSAGGELGPQLWRVDPTGLVLGLRAVCVGARETDASQKLERHLRALDGEVCDTTDAALTMCLRVLVDVLGTALTGDDLEVGIVEEVDGAAQHRVLDAAQIDELLTRTHEED
eukprot:gnl/Chilomastix_cuspidata/1352.p1 GENE.gnl/Chilomastix_cuspidata/1352~~gnl/Chilomastix_cuspidata/1352.p1  ORF type:complete len:255 (-),score=135.00 gnl/Chilomastix_cuspidata/1352:35-799(-)